MHAKNSIRIAPSILNAQRDDLINEILRVSQESDLLHLDIMDNIFVPNKTFDFEEGSRIVSQSVLPVDTHLMVVEPEIWGEKYAVAGSQSVTFHYEATEKRGETIERIHDAGSLVGLALKPGTPWESAIEWIDSVEMILIMTVEPGFGGQKFMENMMEKVSKLRSELDERLLNKVRIEVDGGIAVETIAIARKAGADTFVAGSAVYKDENPGSVVSHLRQVAANVDTSN
jgi:ribulose-phosphate 3-epimerase